MASDPQNERLEAWLGFGKVAVGTALVGIVTAVVNLTIQNREIKLKELQNEQELILEKEKFEQETLAQYLEVALDKDLEKRIQFAHYFASLTRSDEMQGKWGKYLNDLEREKGEREANLEKERLELAKLETEVASASVEGRDWEAPDLIRQITAKQQEIERKSSLLYGNPLDINQDSRAVARTAELEGFAALLDRDVEAAIGFFGAATKAWPDYHNVSEIRTALRNRHGRLTDRATSDAAWSALYRDVLTNWSWGMSSELQRQFRQRLN